MNACFRALAGLLATAGVLTLSLPATAAPDFSLGSYKGPVAIEWDNWESFTNNGSGMILPGDRNYGLVQVTTIQATDGSQLPLWKDGQNGIELWGLFRDITVSNLSPSASGIYLDSVGGELDLYLNPAGTAAKAGGAAQGSSGYANAGCAINTLCYHGITDGPDSTLALSLRWVPGIAPGVTVRGDFALGGPPSGTAAGYLEITGGVYADMFNDDHLLGGLADVLFSNTIFANGLDGNPIGDWQLRSVGKLDANVVSEPGGLILAAAAMGALGWRRRKSRTAE